MKGGCSSGGCVNYRSFLVFNLDMVSVLLNIFHILCLSESAEDGYCSRERELFW